MLPISSTVCPVKSSIMKHPLNVYSPKNLITHLFVPLDALVGPICVPITSTSLSLDQKNVSFLDIANIIKASSVLMYPLGESIFLEMLSSMRLNFPFPHCMETPGARLRSELSLLPSNILNTPLHVLGNEQLDDQQFDFPNATNFSGANLEENSAGNHISRGAPAGSRTEADPALTPTISPSGSGTYSPARTTRQQPTLPASPAHQPGDTTSPLLPTQTAPHDRVHLSDGATSTPVGSRGTDGFAPGCACYGWRWSGIFCADWICCNLDYF